MRSSIVQLLCILSFLYLGQNLLIWSERRAYKTGSNYFGQLPPVPKPQLDCNKPNQAQQSVLQLNSQSITTSTHIACSPPRTFDTSTSTCECLFGTEYYPQTNQCLCPIAKPLWNGNGCVECNLNGGFNTDNIGCISCPEGFMLNLQGGTVYCQPVV